MSQFHMIERFAYVENRLSVDVVELLECAPDGFVGSPLLILENSRRYFIEFTEVGRVVVEPEPVAPNYKDRVEEAAFLLRESSDESALLVKHRWGASVFNFGRRFGSEEDLRHYLVHAENFVIQVLTLTAPSIVEIIKANPSVLPATSPLN